MTLIYILIGLAVVYTAFILGRRKKSNPNYIATGHDNQNIHAHAHEQDSTGNSQKQHKRHGCC